MRRKTTDPNTKFPTSRSKTKKIKKILKKAVIIPDFAQKNITPNTKFPPTGQKLKRKKLKLKKKLEKKLKKTEMEKKELIKSVMMTAFGTLWTKCSARLF